MSVIYQDECLELGLPLPLKHEKQIDYVKRVLISGLVMNTRMARYIGIANLHSVASALRKQRFPHSIEHKCAYCPKTLSTPTRPVDVVWMDQEQRKQYLEAKENAPS